MGIFGFGDNSDYRLHVHPGHGGRWYWTLLDGLNNVRAVPTFHGGPTHGFETYIEARGDAREVIEGLGADFKDLEVV